MGLHTTVSAQPHHVAAAAPYEILGHRVNWVLLFNASLGQFLAGLSSRVFMISLPSIAAGLQTDILGMAWALIAFQLASVGFSLVFGKLGDILGRQFIYFLGFITLSASSVFCGLSRNVLQLTTFRFLQGLGGGMTRAVSRAIAIDAMPAGMEGKATGVMAVAFSAGFFVGPPLGGLIVEMIHWRAIFFLIGGVALIGVALSYGRPKLSLRANAVSRRSVDFAGALWLMMLTMGLIVLFDKQAAELLGVEEKAFWGVVWVLMFLGFLLHETKSECPIIKLSAFRISMFTWNIVSLVLLSITRGFITFVMPFYLQQVLAFSPSFIGFVFLLPPLFSLALAPVAGHTTDKIGPTLPAIAGISMSVLAVLLGTSLKIDSGWMVPGIMLSLLGMGTGLFNSPNQAAIIGSTPEEDRGFANGMVHTGFELGHMLGVSGGSVLMIWAFQYYSGDFAATLNPQHQQAFVTAMNFTYGIAVFVSLTALLAAASAGTGKIKAAKQSA